MQQGLAFPKRQVINHTLHKSVPTAVADFHVVALEVQIEGRASSVVPASIAHIRSVRQSLCKGVGSSQQKPATHPMIESCLQGVVIRASWLEQKIRGGRSAKQCA